MLRRYPAGSTCGSGALGRLVLGMVGGMFMVILEKPGVPGVTGDLREDCEDMEPMSARLDEFLREPPDVVEPDVFLREKRPMVVVVDLSRNVELIENLCDSRTCQVSRAGGVEQCRLEGDDTKPLSGSEGVLKWCRGFCPGWREDVEGRGSLMKKMGRKQRV